MDHESSGVISWIAAVTKKSRPKAKQSKKGKPAPKSKAPKQSDELRPEELDEVSGGTMDLSLAARDLTGPSGPSRGALGPYVPILAAAKLPTK